MEYLFISVIHSAVTPLAFLLCTAASLILGIAISLVTSYKSTSSSGYRVTLALLPIIIQVIIMLVNGNLGAGVAVAGAFSLIRFRSTQASAKEISNVLLVTAVGIATGMGYIGIALLTTVLILPLYFIYCKFYSRKKYKIEKLLKITIPESINYTDCFTDIFDKYLDKYELIETKTTNFGTMYKLSYKIIEKNVYNEKDMIDEIRARNANLDIICSVLLPNQKDEL